jgi:hypothetical protein
MTPRNVAAVLALGAAVLGANARAEDLDDSRLLVCDLAEAAQCDGVAECRDVTAMQIDLPPVVLVDFESKQLTSEDGARTSPIIAVEKLDATLLLQGHRNGRGWTMVIDRATGHLSATMADVEGAFVLAGACAVHSPD